MTKEDHKKLPRLSKLASVCRILRSVHKNKCGGGGNAFVKAFGCVSGNKRVSVMVSVAVAFIMVHSSENLVHTIFADNFLKLKTYTRILRKIKKRLPGNRRPTHNI